MLSSVPVTFDAASSHGQVAMVIYEWKDVKYLGKVTSETDDSLPVSDVRVDTPTALSRPFHISRKPTSARLMP